MASDPVRALIVLICYSARTLPKKIKLIASAPGADSKEIYTIQSASRKYMRGDRVLLIDAWITVSTNLFKSDRPVWTDDIQELQYLASNCQNLAPGGFRHNIQNPGGVREIKIYADKAAAQIKFDHTGAAVSASWYGFKPNKLTAPAVIPNERCAAQLPVIPVCGAIQALEHDMIRNPDCKPDCEIPDDIPEDTPDEE